jgi:hypothetical protein
LTFETNLSRLTQIQTAMLHNRFNPLFAKAEDSPPPNTGGSAPEKPETNGEEPEGEQEEDPEPPAPGKETTEPAAPATPAASAPKLNAFQRGALRALGTGELISRVEKAEAQNVVDSAEISRLTTENTRLTNELSQFKTETPKKIEAAQKGRADDVSKGVRGELTKLGITEAAAPPQLGAEETDKTMTRADFRGLSATKKSGFIKNGGKLTD